jgi:tRNA (cmo5U34)-methyltransferase
MSSRAHHNDFTGRIGEEYDTLSLICPNAAVLTRKLGETVGAWRAGEALVGLEIGCGDGRSTRALLSARDNLNLIALDSSAAMLTQARVKLANYIEVDRVAFVEADALTHLNLQPDASFDIVASNYAIHNFAGDYRKRVLAEIYRVLKPGGLFINGDRYAYDDPAQHLAATQADLRTWFKILGEKNRYDLLEDWVVHLFSDESSAHIMYLTQGLADLETAGFSSVRVDYREGVDTLVVAEKM